MFPKLNSEKVDVHIWESKGILIISMVTDDQEAIELTRIALLQWFKDRGLKRKNE